MAESARKIFIATPTANGIMLSDYVVSIMAMSADLHGRGIGTVYRNIDGPNVALQRDMLAGEFLAGECTHLLFVDSDMAFPAELCSRLLDAGKRLIGTIYAQRRLDLPRLAKLLDGRDFHDALALAHDWNVHLSDSTITVVDGLCRVDALGTGFLLIERACFTEMLERTEVPLYSATNHQVKLRAFFRELSEDGAVWSHDYAFCRRWTGAGGEVWADTNANIKHVGDFRFGMPFRAYLQALRTKRPDPQG